MDMTDYDEQMEKKINEGPYWHLKLDPLPGHSLRKKNIEELQLVRFVLPRLKGLLKIHKSAKKVREIISADESPSHKLAKWLVKEF